MAGGVGARLYPLSTVERPKQFLDILGTGRTMIQTTYDRLCKLSPDAVFWVVTSAVYAHFIKEQLPSIPDERILLEPEPRNTAPCISYASRKIFLRDSDASVIVSPSDAYIPDEESFTATMHTALSFISSHSSIVCVGINPDSPSTRYGYIRAGSPVQGVCEVLEFKEKPDLQTALRYLRDGGYLWNAGIFVWKVSHIESELRRHLPQIETVMDEIEPHLYAGSESECLSRLFPACQKISIDYGLMEKADDIYVVPADWEWSDLGSFEAIEKVMARNSRGDR